MDILCFIGLSISPEEAGLKLNATYFGPVIGGDIPAAIAEYHPRAIGIIDGLFHTQPAVLHKDILYALSLGIEVFGAASIGALRAAELHEFGMIGVGEIYQRFASGEWVGDDEVAVPCVFNPRHGWLVAEGYEPLVNIRATIECAVQRGVVSPEVAGQIIGRAMSLCFMERHWDVVLDAKYYGANAPALQSLRVSLNELRVDIKKNDALSLLEAIRVWSACDDGSHPNGTCMMPRGPFWDEALFSRPLSVSIVGEGCDPVRGEVPLLCDLLDYSIVDGPAGSTIFQDAMIRTLLLELGTILGIVANKDEIESCKIKIFATVDNIKSKLTPLNEVEIEALAADEVVCERLFDHYCQLSNRGLLLTLLAESLFEPLKKKLRCITSDRRMRVGTHNYTNEKESTEIVEGYLSRVGVKNAKDYFKRYVDWMPAHRKRFLASILSQKS